MATSGGKRRDEASDNSDDELAPLANEIYGGRYAKFYQKTKIHRASALDQCCSSN